MALPNPDRTIPNTDTVGPPGPSGGAFADKVAAEVQRIWDLVPNMLVNIGGSADAITAKCDPPLISSYIHGQRFWLIPAANNTGPVTIDIDQRGQVDVVSYNGQQLQAGDLVAGEGTELVYDGDNNQMRLVHPTARELLSRASGGATLWEQIGDSGEISAAVASVEFTFPVDRYVSVSVFMNDLRRAVNGSSELNVTLRNASAAIVTLTSGTSGSPGAPARFTARTDFVLGRTVELRSLGFGWYAAIEGAQSFTVAHGTNSTPPDRVRVAFTSGNIGSGRVTAYGLRIEPD